MNNMQHVSENGNGIRWRYLVFIVIKYQTNCLVLGVSPTGKTTSSGDITIGVKIENNSYENIFILD